MSFSDASLTLTLLHSDQDSQAVDCNPVRESKCFGKDAVVLMTHEIRVRTCNSRWCLAGDL